MNFLRAVLFIGILATTKTSDGLLRSARGEVRGFRQLADAADKSGGLFTVMAFQLIQESRHLEPRDTSSIFRIWFRFDPQPEKQPKLISEIWFDWTIEGNSPSNDPQSGPIIVLRSSTHPALVQKITRLLTDNTSSPDHPAFILPPIGLATLIGQCIALGEHPNRDTLRVGMIDCLDPDRLVNEHDFHVVARAGDAFLLLSQLGPLQLEYCEPAGVRLSVTHFNLLSDSIRMSKKGDITESCVL